MDETFAVYRKGSGLDDVVDHTEPDRSVWDHKGGFCD
jgi:hypothetical protein